MCIRDRIEYAAGDPVFVDANGDNDLYAVWQVKTYTVTWKNDDGSVLRTDKDVAVSYTHLDVYKRQL